MKTDNVYYVVYNGKFIAKFRKIQSALNFIARRSLKDDEDNSLYISDRIGITYNPTTGELTD